SGREVAEREVEPDDGSPGVELLDAGRDLASFPGADERARDAERLRDDPMREARVETRAAQRAHEGADVDLGSTPRLVGRVHTGRHAPIIHGAAYRAVSGGLLWRGGWGWVPGEAPVTVALRRPGDAPRRHRPRVRQAGCPMAVRWARLCQPA